MTYRTGTIANTLPTYNLIISVLQQDMLNVGWKLWSTNNGNVVANQYMWRVYKSPGSGSANGNNSIGTDWFMGLGWDIASNGNLIMTIMESYENVTNTIQNYCPNTAPTPIANGACNANPTALPNITGSNAMYLATNTQSALSQSNTVYYYSVTIDRLILCTSNGSGVANFGVSMYGGMYDSFMANTLDTMPIVLFNLTANNASQSPPMSANALSGGAFFTREPYQSTSLATNFCGSYNPFNNYSISMPVEGYTQRYLSSRALLMGRTITAYTGSYIRGLLKDVWFVNSVNNIVGPTRGDIIQFVQNGVTITATNINPYGIYNYTSWCPYFAQV